MRTIHQSKPVYNHVYHNNLTEPSSHDSDNEEEMDQISTDEDNNDNGSDAEEAQAQDIQQASSRSKWSKVRPANNIGRRGSADVVKKGAGPRGEARLARTALESFLAFIARIVQTKNVEIEKQRPEKHENEPRYRETCSEEIKCLIGIFIFRGLHRDIKSPSCELWYDEDAARPMYRACMDRDRFQYLLKCLAFRDHRT